MVDTASTIRNHHLVKIRGLRHTMRWRIDGAAHSQAAGIFAAAGLPELLTNQTTKKAILYINLLTPAIHVLIITTI